MIGSHYVSFTDPRKNKQEDKSMVRLVGGSDNLDGVKPFSGQLSRFSDLKNQPLGSIPSIFFWNNEQLEILNDLKTNQHILILVDIIIINNNL